MVFKEEWPECWVFHSCDKIPAKKQLKREKASSGYVTRTPVHYEQERHGGRTWKQLVMLHRQAECRERRLLVFDSLCLH